MRALICVGVLMCASGCSLIRTEIAPAVAKQVQQYCLEPETTRALVRAEVNTMIAPNRIQVTCAE